MLHVTKQFNLYRKNYRENEDKPSQNYIKFDFKPDAKNNNEKFDKTSEKMEILLLSFVASTVK